MNTQCCFCAVFRSENTLFGMGNPLLDISAVVDKDFLDKYDCYCPLQSRPFAGLLTYFNVFFKVWTEAK